VTFVQLFGVRTWGSPPLKSPVPTCPRGGQKGTEVLGGHPPPPPPNRAHNAPARNPPPPPPHPPLFSVPAPTEFFTLATPLSLHDARPI
jgi:hypothetical protein